MKIKDEDLKDAKLSVADFGDEEVRKRAFIDVLGARLAMKIFFSQKVEANNLYSLYTIHHILEELDIADIYYRNIKLDIRLVFNKDEIFIPKSQFEYKLTPDLYSVLLLNEDMSSVELLGFFEPDKIQKKNANNEFYFFDYEDLQKADNLKNFLDDFTPKAKPKHLECSFEKAQELFISLIDKDILRKDKFFLFTQLANSAELREKMVEFENFETISKEVVKKEEYSHDFLLDIVGAQQVYEEENEEEQNTKADIHEEVLSDLLEGNIDNKVIEKRDEKLLEELQELQTPKFKNTEDKDKSSKTNNINLPPIIAGGAIIGGAVLPAGAAIPTPDVPNDLAAGLKNFLPKVGLDNQDILDLPASVENTDKEAFSTIDDLVLDDPIIDEEKFEHEIEEGVKKFLPKVGVDNENDETLAKADDLDFNADEKGHEQLPENGSITEEKPTEEENVEQLGDNDFEQSLDELPEIENPELYEEDVNLEEELETLESDAPVIETEVEDKSEDEDLSLDTLNFDILSDSPEPVQDFQGEADTSAEDLMLLDLTEESGETQQEEIDEKSSEVLQMLNKLEAEEEGIALDDGEVNTSNADDDLINQIDGLLTDIEKSPDSELLAGLDVEDVSSDEVQEEEEIVFFQKTEDEEIVQPQEDGSSDLLKALFEKENLKEGAVEPEELKIKFEFTKNKKMIIAASVASVVLASAIIGGIAGHKNNSNMNLAQNNIPAQSTPQAGDIGQQGMSLDNQMAPIEGSQEAALNGGMPQAMPNKDMGQSVSDAFSSEPVTANVTKVAWEVPEDVAYNDSFRRYLQMAGKSLKLNLQNNLLLATEMAYSSKVIVDLNISKDGGLQGANVAVSSGSKQIDKIVLQSVKETLKYLKMPSDELSGQSLSATLIINF